MDLSSKDGGIAFVESLRVEARQGSHRSVALRRALTVARLVPWACALVVLVLCAFVGAPALERWNRGELGSVIARAGTPHDVRALQASDAYVWTVVLVLGLVGLLLVLLERLYPETRDPFAGRGRLLGESGVPPRALGWIAAVLVLVVGAHRAVRAAGVELDTAPTFPLNVFHPLLHASGAPFALAFLAVFFWAWCRERGSARLAWTIGLLLLLLGNLVQGGLFEGFVGPFVLSDIQYFHEAQRVGDWRSWIGGFNDFQASLTNHARTHPPFAVLANYFPWRWFGVDGLAALFVLVASLAMPVFHRTVRLLGADEDRAFRLSLLLAVLPAFNVYGATSLDALVATAVAVSLLGLVAIDRGASRPLHFLAFAGGLVAANLLTFGGLLPFAIAGHVGALRARDGRWAVARAVGATVAIACIAWLATRALTGYDHREALATATRIENPHGFALLHDAGDYVATRVEGLVELGLFLSIGVLAWCLRGSRWRRDPSGGIAQAALLVFVLALVAGTFRHGETARACLFLYPYLLLFLRDAPVRALDACLVLAALQTTAQQLTGFFFW